MRRTAHPPASPSRIVAVLGPTNTGKTHFAMERMLGHASGMIGFPLRLLARENYDRAVRLKGRDHVALITGEEKIIPGGARYFLCTVESMPLGRPVAFLAVDEIQMCADPDRGHVFTDRLLHARGEAETMFMGAETIRPLLRRLVPEADILCRPRFSRLSYGGARKLQRLPPRSAIVAFTAADVYALAEVIRRQRGGTAVVLGALSPRTRNAQVALYQAGEVDYLVATDAIGMGLNMDIDHVAFAATRKFDGRVLRPLKPAELAQIAGRAGRHMNDGSFGTTGDIGPFEPEVAERIEMHRFDPLRQLFWRSSDLGFTSLAHLRSSLARPSGTAGLVRAREADDELVLAALARDAQIAALARSPAAVRLLWEVCQVPDFRKELTDGHTRLLAHIFRSLMGADGGDGRLPTDWIARQVDRLDRVTGDIDTLMQRIAHIRTWTYVAYRGDWVADAGHWQERTRAIEDKLSDALHDRLIQRFVDRSTSVLVSRLKERGPLLAAVTATGDVVVEGEPVGAMEGFRFNPDEAVLPTLGADSTARRVVGAAVARALGPEVARRLRRLEHDEDDAFALAADGRITWRGTVVGRLAAGPHPRQPSIEPDVGDLVDTAGRDRLRARLAGWCGRHLEDRFATLGAAEQADVTAPGRGLVFQMAEALGSVPRHRVAAQVAAMTASDMATLRRLGLVFGRETVFLPSLLRPKAIELRRLLWNVFQGSAPRPGGNALSEPVDPAVPAAAYEAVGFRVLGAVAIRVDALERLAARTEALDRQGGFCAVPALARLVGVELGDLPDILAGLGYEAEDGIGITTFRRRTARRPRGVASRRRKRRGGDAAHSPFAGLRELVPSR
jgi:ATP-dependent RNA helicase SUPV3L1/SUV3